MCIAFAIMFIGLSILDIEYALLIALGIAFLDALPFFGSGLVLWPWSLISFLNGNIKLGVGLIVIYAAVCAYATLYRAETCKLKNRYESDIDAYVYVYRLQNT